MVFRFLVFGFRVFGFKGLGFLGLGAHGFFKETLYTISCFSHMLVYYLMAYAVRA